MFVPRRVNECVPKRVNKCLSQQPTGAKGYNSVCPDRSKRVNKCPKKGEQVFVPTANRRKR